MRYLPLILVLCLVGCFSQKQAFDSSALSAYQVKVDGPGNGLPGKCYQEMKSSQGVLEWYEIICPSRKKAYVLASECLRKLGYKLTDASSFRTSSGNALLDFQKSEQLSYGALDEATLKRLIQKAGSF